MGTGVYAFRMLICQFRREMAFDDIFSFWERLWAAEQLAGTQLKVPIAVSLVVIACKVSTGTLIWLSMYMDWYDCDLHHQSFNSR